MFIRDIYINYALHACFAGEICVIYVLFIDEFGDEKTVIELLLSFLW